MLTWRHTGWIALLLAAAACAVAAPQSPQPDDGPFVVVLGIAQDAGSPQAGCDRPCCAAAWSDPTLRRHVACLGLVDPRSGQRWLIDATPDLIWQLHALDAIQPPKGAPGLDGILLTHAHIGHYTGLMFLGQESIGAREVPVHAMPRMRQFLETNGPWDQLVRYRNIDLRPMAAGEPVVLNERLSVTPLRVPHREEYSEVVGFRIRGPDAEVLYIPDIDKWERWDRPIEDLLGEVDRAYLDGTFFADGEVPHRPMDEIPHPFIAESMGRFADLPAPVRGRIRFIHLNHTNPALRPGSEARARIESAGFAVAEELERFGL